MADNNQTPPQGSSDLPEQTQDTNRIIPVNIEDQMKQAYIDYSMSVIVGRALPDVRDGLKPVHRRVLFAMNELGISSNKPYKKSARVVGEVLGKYHPHGDSSVYDAMVRMAQPWSMSATLIDGQGNFGSQDGDNPAAMRYTEVRMSRTAEAMMEDLEKETVDFALNFDDSLQEPTVLPSRIPQLLVNGSAGIAVGMATNMMPHNLGEVVDGCIAYIGNREITVDELMHYVKAPDFPTGAVIWGMEGIKAAAHTGRGRVVLRGHTTIETSKTGKESIVITSVPYQVSRDELTDKIGRLVNDKVIDGITHVGNESNKEGTRIVIELRKDVVAQVVINQLYKYSELQTSFGINNVALVGGRPRTLNLKQLVEEFVTFRHEVVERRTAFELREARKRAHILEGYLIALDHLDEVIALIRAASTPNLAQEGLMTRFGMSEIQAKAVLELRLQRLTGMERDKIREEHAELMNTIARLEEILGSEELRYAIIKEELEDVRRRFGMPRRTEIQLAGDEMDILDFIKEEDVVITVSHLGYVKRTTTADYRAQRRGGRGAIGGRTRDEDFIEHLFIANTHHTLLLFTEKGRCYWLPVHRIPEGDRTGKGRPIQNFVQLPGDDKVRAIIDVPALDDKESLQGKCIVLCTRGGIIKKTSLEDFSRPRASGVNAITIVEGDQLLDVALTDGQSYVLMAVRSGRAICFPEDRVRVTGRGAIGVYGIDMEEGKDEVVGMVCVSKADLSKQILVVSEKGMGKRTPFLLKAGQGGEEAAELSAEEVIPATDSLDEFPTVASATTDPDAIPADGKVDIPSTETGAPEHYELSYRVTNRGGKGVKTINVTEKTGGLVGFLAVESTDDLMITCRSGITIRMRVAAIREAGRATQGVRLINIDEGDSIAAIARLDEQEVEEVVEGADESAADAASGEAPAAEATDENSSPEA